MIRIEFIFGYFYNSSALSTTQNINLSASRQLPKSAEIGIKLFKKMIKTTAKAKRFQTTEFFG